MKNLGNLLKRKLLPSWLKCPRSIWASAIALSFIMGYLMGMYEESDSPIEDVDMREDPLQHHYEVVGDDYGFHRRKKDV